MSVVQSIEDKGPWTKELVIEVPSEDVEAEVSSIVKELGGQVRMPGFRSGKVPASLVRSRFKAEIEKEVTERLLPRFWQQAKAEHALDTLIAPRVEDVKIVNGEPMTFKAVVEVRPQIELDPNREFELPSAEILVGEAEVDEVIEKIQNDLATFDPVERAAGRGDRVRLKIKETPGEISGDAENGESGAEDQEAEPQELTIEVGEDRVWEELSLAVTGLEAGGKGDITHQQPAREVPEGEEPIAAPPPRHFQFEVLEVSEKQVAAADDDLAQRVSDFGTVSELRTDVENRIFEDKKQKRRQERESRLLEQLCERNPMELPEGIVAEEIQTMMRNYAERLTKGGIDLEQAGLDWNKISEEMAPQAKQRVHAQLVLDAVAKADSIEVPDAQVASVVTQIARARSESLGAVQDELQRSGGMAALRTDLLRQRTLRHLLGEPLDVEPAADGVHVHGPDCDHSHDDDQELGEDGTDSAGLADSEEE